MDRKVKKVMPGFPPPPKAKRVAAYARVSIDKDTMQHSLFAQVSYYNDLIQNHAGWQFAGIYADYAASGTKEDREEFNRMLNDCKEGKIDMIITKSISRFARNTVTLLQTVRALKDRGVDVYFEEQNIHSSSSDGELMLTLLASFAQEEALSFSENMKWAVKKHFEEGKPWCGALLGYRMRDGKYEIIPHEAQIVKRIFSDYLNGKGIEAITKELNKDGILTRKGYRWHKYVVDRTLRCYTYTGNLILQTTYSENYLTKTPKKNTGELPKYHVKDAHEAIIDEEIFDKVQEERKRRADKYKPYNKQFKSYPYTGLITCANCGKHYRRKKTSTGFVWICTTFNSEGKTACASKQIPEKTLDEMCVDINLCNVEQILACDDNRLLITLKNGREVEKVWKDRSRAESWTDEMKQKARERRLRNA